MSGGSGFRRCSFGLPRGENVTFGKKPLKWGFPKIRGTLFWGPYNKDPTI